MQEENLIECPKCHVEMIDPDYVAECDTCYYVD